MYLTRHLHLSGCTLFLLAACNASFTGQPTEDDELGSTGLGVDSTDGITCTCNSGFTPTGPYTCEDIDECALNNGGCDPLTVCTNTTGSFTCGQCPTGYTGDGSTGCMDVDECGLNTDTCATTANCQNTTGSFSCSCPDNTVGTGVGEDGCTAQLSGLVPSVGTLVPAFSSTVTSYTLLLPQGVRSYTLTPSVQNAASAQITVDGQGVTADSASQVLDTLPLDSTDAAVEVTASGFATTYTVTASRQEAYVKASLPRQSSAFGFRLGLSEDGSTMVVGAYLEASAATGVDGDEANSSAAGAGAAYVMVRDASGWTKQAYLKASNTGAGDGFGMAVAIGDEVIAVGAPTEDSDGSSPANNGVSASGAAYVFRRSGTTWSGPEYLKAPTPTVSSQFGRSLALSADGNTLAVGAPGRAGGGAVYLFTWTGSAWSAVPATLTASNAETGDAFGVSVSLSSDGTMLAVGASGEDSDSNVPDTGLADNTASGAGAAYVFEFTGSAWDEVSYLKPFNSDASDGFGTSVALSADGTTAAVGASGEDANATSVDGLNNSQLGSGAAYVFVSGVSGWTQESYLKASNAEAGAKASPSDGGDGFGQDVRLTADGNRLLVGALREDGNGTGLTGTLSNNSTINAGAAYVFERTGSDWDEIVYVKAANTGAADAFGRAVAMSDDGSTLCAGADGEDSSSTDPSNNSASGAGAVYCF